MREYWYGHISERTKVRMHDGSWKYAGDIIKGDKILGASSNEVTVLDTCSNTRRKLFDIVDKSRDIHYTVSRMHRLFSTKYTKRVTGEAITVVRRRYKINRIFLERLAINPYVYGYTIASIRSISLFDPNQRRMVNKNILTFVQKSVYNKFACLGIVNNNVEYNLNNQYEVIGSNYFHQHGYDIMGRYIPIHNIIYDQVMPIFNGICDAYGTILSHTARLTKIVKFFFDRPDDPLAQCILDICYRLHLVFMVGSRKIKIEPINRETFVSIGITYIVVTFSTGRNSTVENIAPETDEYQYEIVPSSSNKEAKIVKFKLSSNEGIMLENGIVI